VRGWWGLADGSVVRIANHVPDAAALRPGRVGRNGTSMRMSNRRAFALVLAGALALSACGDAPDDDTEPAATDATTEETEATGDTEAPGDTEETEAPPATGDAADFRGCLVTDAGGVDDRSFNQTAYEGLERARDELGIEIALLESTSETDFEPNIEAFLGQDCDLIITVGFLLGDVTEAAAQANPDQNFAIVDYAYEDDYDNLRELVFATDQAAFLAGYVAAGVTETDAVGTYGGINIPTVSIFMDGYLAGVNYYNEENGTNVEVIGWDGTDGSFTGNFDSQDDGRNVTDSLLEAGADIIMPVAGPVGLGTAAALQDFGSGKMIWVDTDGYESVEQFRDLILTSVMKKMDNAVFDTVEAGVNDAFEGGLYLGTLENEGVDIAPFHDFEDEVPQEVKDALPGLRDGIISGEIEVTP
jgi:basic membrane protein A and related proteins